MHDLIHDIGNCAFLFVCFFFMVTQSNHAFYDLCFPYLKSLITNPSVSLVLFALELFGGYSLSILNSVDAQLSMMCQVLNCVQILTA